MRFWRKAEPAIYCCPAAPSAGIDSGLITPAELTGGLSSRRNAHRRARCSGSRRVQARCRLSEADRHTGNSPVARATGAGLPLLRSCLKVAFTIGLFFTLCLGLSPASVVHAVPLDETPTAQPTVPTSAAFPLLRITFSEGERQVVAEGRAIVEAQDGGILLEERNGRVRQLTPAMIQSREALPDTFRPMSADELAVDLLSQVPAGFETIETLHYVICFNSAEEYAEFCGKLLEHVFDEYFEFMKGQGVVVAEPVGKLPIIIFLSESEFKEYAAKQHPETSFENTPGYYTIRDNQTLLTDLTRDRSMRTPRAIRKRLAEQPLQVATVVHEAVHQLAFNSGLQTRMADNPLWLSEGLALYFEPITPRASLLWTGPGSVNARHHPEFVKCASGDSPVITFGQLIESDKSFLGVETLPAAYAESWGLTMYLFRREKAGMTKYLTNLSQRKPLQSLTAEQRTEEFRAAFGKSPDEMEREIVSYIRNLKVPR